MIFIFLFLKKFIILTSFIYRHVLLKNPGKDIKIKNTLLSGNATNILTNETIEINLETEFNNADRNDNPFSFFPTSVEAAYFWINGDWIQRDRFDFWAIEVVTIVASLFIVIVLQNMLIAFMG